MSPNSGLNGVHSRPPTKEHASDAYRHKLVFPCELAGAIPHIQTVRKREDSEHGASNMGVVRGSVTPDDRAQEIYRTWYRG